MAGAQDGRSEVRVPLKPHPDTPCAAVDAIEVALVRSPAGALHLHYVVRGSAADIVLPPPASPLRTDGLWQHTCFEAFLRGPEGAGYQELNFAPSTRWAAYGFDDYRSGMREAAIAPPRIRLEARSGGLDLHVEVDPVPAGLPPDGPWQLGLCAVIEEADGRRSYWALAHPPGKPDFHHRDCFALKLAPPEQP